jgi:predicted DNA-binding transcriptional regulator YafY
MTKPKLQFNDSEVRAKGLMAASLAQRGRIVIRLNAQIKNAETKAYMGLPGYSIVFNATSQKMVERAFDAIDAALKGL